MPARPASLITDSKTNESKSLLYEPPQVHSNGCSLRERRKVGDSSLTYKSRSDLSVTIIQLSNTLDECKQSGVATAYPLDFLIAWRGYRFM